MGAAGIGMMIGGSVLNAYSQIQAANYNASVARRNAQVSRVGAGDAMLRSQAEAQRIQTRGSVAAAAGSAGAAGANVDVQSGSVLDVLGGSRFITKLDERIAENNGERGSWGRMLEAKQFGEQAARAQAAGPLGAASTLLTGGAQAGMAAYNMGAFNGSPTEGPTASATDNYTPGASPFSYTGMGGLGYDGDLFPVFGRGG